MRLFKRLKGGEASSGPHSIDRKHDTVTRQRRRREAQENARDHVRVKYAGVGRNGNTAWPENFGRRVARASANAMARRSWRQGVDVADGPAGNKAY